MTPPAFQLTNSTVIINAKIQCQGKSQDFSLSEVHAHMWAVKTAKKHGIESALGQVYKTAVPIESLFYKYGSISSTAACRYDHRMEDKFIGVNVVVSITHC